MCHAASLCWYMLFAESIKLKKRKYACKTLMVSGVIKKIELINSRTGDCVCPAHTCTHPVSCAASDCDGCFLRANDLMQEVAPGSAHAEVAGDQKTAYLTKTLLTCGPEKVGWAWKGSLLESNRAHWI